MTPRGPEGGGGTRNHPGISKRGNAVDPEPTRENAQGKTRLGEADNILAICIKYPCKGEGFDFHIEYKRMILNLG